MKISIVKAAFLVGVFCASMALFGQGQQNDPFPHNHIPPPSTVGPAGYIGTSGPTGTTVPGAYTPTGYDPGTETGPQALPGSNAINPHPGTTGPTGPSANMPGVIGTTDYVVPRYNGVTGVTGLPGIPWP